MTVPRWDANTGRDRLERMKPERVSLLANAIRRVLEQGPEQAGRLGHAIKHLDWWDGGEPDARDVTAVWRAMERSGVIESYQDTTRRNNPLTVRLAAVFEVSTAAVSRAASAAAQLLCPVKVPPDFLLAVRNALVVVVQERGGRVVNRG